jgi:mono/diheme cytochrome c family protein
VRRLLALGLVAVSSACGGGDDGPNAVEKQGLQVFKANCARCHTLAPAGAHGIVGPDLEEVKPAAKQVRWRVNFGGGIMPSFKGKLTPAEINAVAVYVSRITGGDKKPFP